MVERLNKASTSEKLLPWRGYLICFPLNLISNMVETHCLTPPFKNLSQISMRVFLCAQKKTQYKESHVDQHNRGLFREARKLHKLCVKWLFTWSKKFKEKWPRLTHIIKSASRKYCAKLFQKNRSSLNKPEKILWVVERTVARTRISVQLMVHRRTTIPMFF